MGLKGGETMYQAVFTVLSSVYALVIRPVLKQAINDPNQEWDEMVMRMVDALFGYTGE